jgi:DNA polymerase-3 subunit epsilon
MVRNSPRFDQILDELWGLLEGRVFVAHNVSFDFGFIRAGFLKAGKDFKPEKLCTVKLSRKAFPNLTSYSLGRLCETQGIRIDARHRAMGDAKATAILFDRIIKKSPLLVSSLLKKNSGEAFLPPNFSGTRFREIPESCGVYYMLDEKGKVIYVGKAINIKERFKNHFSGLALPELKQKLKSEVVDLKWQETGTEFLALLIESLEIKRLWPKYNAALKIPKTLWGLFHYQDGMGYGRLQLAKVTPYLKPLEIFFSSDEANAFLNFPHLLILSYFRPKSVPNSPSVQRAFSNLRHQVFINIYNKLASFQSVKINLFCKCLSIFLLI